MLLSGTFDLGARVTTNGREGASNQLRAAPRNVPQLSSFLGMVNYYHKFIPNASSMMAPLYKLIAKNKPWVWGREQEAAFKKVKACLTSPNVLVHYDPDKALLLSCDASPYGIGAVLSHVTCDEEKPTAYASRTKLFRQCPLPGYNAGL